MTAVSEFPKFSPMFIPQKELPFVCGVGKVRRKEGRKFRIRGNFVNVNQWMCLSLGTVHFGRILEIIE